MNNKSFKFWILSCSKIVRKKLLFFVNVNLTVAILIKNMMLVSGVETARENTVSNHLLVEIVLHNVIFYLYVYIV